MSHDLQNVLSKMQYMFELTDKRPVYWAPAERNSVMSIHERESMERGVIVTCSYPFLPSLPLPFPPPPSILPGEQSPTLTQVHL